MVKSMGKILIILIVIYLLNGDLISILNHHKLQIYRLYVVVTRVLKNASLVSFDAKTVNMTCGFDQITKTNGLLALNFYTTLLLIHY
jgi:membrane-associated PAP2 superfamily phosphatase